MRFKIDEHLPAEIKELLTLHQHDAVTVPDEGVGTYGTSYNLPVKYYFCDTYTSSFVSL
jgi:hypothetical protein